MADVEPSMQARSGSIYLNHQNQNHYNVVLSVHGEESDLTQMRNENCNEYERRSRNRTRMQRVRQSSLQKQEKSNSVEQKESMCTKKIPRRCSIQRKETENSLCKIFV